MIKKIEMLAGLPGDQKSEIKQYSADGRGGFREGVVVKLTDQRDHVWIGNFQPAGSAGHHRFASGVAAILAGANCYLVADQKFDPQIISSPGHGSVWSDFKIFEHHGKPYLLLVGSGGYLACINDTGLVVGSVHLAEPCEDVRVEVCDADKVGGSFYEFNLKKRLPFEFCLPTLSERINPNE